MPHDKDVADVLLPFKPQVVVIAANAGEVSSVWRHLGNPLAPDRAAQLARIVKSAQSNQIPVLFWENSPRKNWEHAVTDLSFDQVISAANFDSTQLKSAITND